MRKIENQTEIMNKLEELVTEQFTTEQYAQEVRRFMDACINMYFFHNQNKRYVCPEWVSKGYYCLTELCEILDPQLQKE